MPWTGFGGDAVVDDVHHAAHGIAAAKQGGGAACDFDAAWPTWGQRHGMVEGQRRGIHRSQAVVHDAYAVPVHAADDRAAHHGAVGGGGYAGQAVQRLAQRVGAAQVQAGAFQHRGGRRHFRASQRITGGDDGGQGNGRGFGGGAALATGAVLKASATLTDGGKRRGKHAARGGAAPAWGGTRRDMVFSKANRVVPAGLDGRGAGCR